LIASHFVIIHRFYIQHLRAISSAHYHHDVCGLKSSSEQWKLRRGH